MTGTEAVVGVILTVLAIAYLVYALIFPERL
jgi:K+-transporting ATPase KdpF subunit